MTTLVLMIQILVQENEKCNLALASPSSEPT